MSWVDHNADPDGHRHWPNEELVRFVGRCKGDIGRQVLEVGCGAGGNLRLLAEHARVVGLDLDPDVLKAAYRNLSAWLDEEHLARTSLITADILREAPGDWPSCFDGIVDSMVSQHFDWLTHFALYRKYRAWLRPGGWLFLYHLSDVYRCRRGTVQADCLTVAGLPDLFPTAGQFCLAGGHLLAEALGQAGFAINERRSVSKGYPSGAIAEYSVIVAEAQS